MVQVRRYANTVRRIDQGEVSGFAGETRCLKAPTQAHQPFNGSALGMRTLVRHTSIPNH